MQTTFTAFEGEKWLAAGSQLDVALSVKAATLRDAGTTILIFEDQTGRQIDFDLRGSEEDIAARLSRPETPAEKRPTGRPRLGVVAREVTLLPRHWDWLAAQPGGASVTLRKLVDGARGRDGGQDARRQSQQAADRFLSAMLGNQPGYEEATRALYAGDRPQFVSLTAPWPKDLRDHVLKLAEGAFVEKGPGELPASAE